MQPAKSSKPEQVYYTKRKAKNMNYKFNACFMLKHSSSVPFSLMLLLVIIFLFANMTFTYYFRLVWMMGTRNGKCWNGMVENLLTWSFLIRVEFCYLEKNIYYWEILQTNICHGGKRSQVNVVFRLRLLKHVFHQYFISFSCKHQFIDFIRRSMLFPRFKERKRSAINQHKYACLWPAKRLCKKRV